MHPVFKLLVTHGLGAQIEKCTSRVDYHILDLIATCHIAQMMKERDHWSTSSNPTYRALSKTALFSRSVFLKILVHLMQGQMFQVLTEAWYMVSLPGQSWQRRSSFVHRNTWFCRSYWWCRRRSHGFRPVAGTERFHKTFYSAFWFPLKASPWRLLCTSDYKVRLGKNNRALRKH